MVHLTSREVLQLKMLRDAVVLHNRHARNDPRVTCSMSGVGPDGELQWVWDVHSPYLEVQGQGGTVQEALDKVTSAVLERLRGAAQYSREKATEHLERAAEENRAANNLEAVAAALETAYQETADA